MLFDLRAPGRKRAIQAVYIILAVVLVGGTILFGVGTGLPGIIDPNNGGSNQELSDQNKDRLEQLQKRVDANPRDAAAWASIASVRFAVGIEKIPQESATATPEAKEEFQRAARAWDRYVALKPDPVDIQVAKRMAQAFSPENLNQPAKWAYAQGLVSQDEEAKAEQDGSKVAPDTYLTLLEAQYAAKLTNAAKVTEGKLREDIPKSQEKLLNARIALAKDPKDAAALKTLQEAQGGAEPGGTITLPEDE